jgi:predicted kinase
MSNNRTVIIMRGLPGSGKSTVAKLFHDAFIVSMDSFWIQPDGTYKFDKSRINEAVQFTKDKFTSLMDVDTDLIVVDNTNTQEWEYEWFKRQAEEMGYAVHLVEVQRSILDCHAACTHQVHFLKILDMAERFERPASATLDNHVRQLMEIVANMNRALVRGPL